MYTHSLTHSLYLTVLLLQWNLSLSYEIVIRRHLLLFVLMEEILCMNPRVVDVAASGESVWRWWQLEWTCGAVFVVEGIDM